MNKTILEQRYLELVDSKKTTIQIREELQKQAVLNNWFEDSLPGQIRSTLARLWDKNIVFVDKSHIVHKK